MKKNLIYIVVLFLSIFSFSDLVFSDCSVKADGRDIDITKELEECLTGSPLVNSGNAEIGSGGGFDTYILKWVKNIGLYLGIFAVLSIVVGSFMLTTSAGEDEKVNKAKGVIKWGILGFLGVMSASAIITIIVKLFYSI